MCYGCYEEYGKPALVTPQTIRVAELCEALYEYAPSGGNCHIVTDDWNLEDDHIEFCQKQVSNGGWLDERIGEKDDTDPDQLAIEKQLLELIAPMSLDERASALAIWNGFIDLPQSH